jgi:hypothetical protein
MCYCKAKALSQLNMLIIQKGKMQTPTEHVNVWSQVPVVIVIQVFAKLAALTEVLSPYPSN